MSGALAEILTRIIELDQDGLSGDEVIEEIEKDYAILFENRQKLESVVNEFIATLKTIRRMM